MESPFRASTGDRLTRRQFGRRVVLATTIATVRPIRPVSSPVARWFAALDDSWKERLCLPFDHPARLRVEENWAVVEPSIADLPAEPAAICREIVEGLGNRAWRQRIFRVMNEDAGGLDAYHVALFGRPDRPEPAELVLTGRHLTIRADAHRPGAFSRRGPFFYGHASTVDNVWRFQDDQARDCCRSLDDRQRRRAFSADGIGLSDLSDAQAAPFRDLLRTLAPLDDGEAVRQPAGFRLAFHPGDSAGDFTSIWTVKGNGMSWSFHGIPHVHGRVEFSGEA